MLKFHALLGEWFRVLQKRLHLFVPRVEFLHAKMLVNSDAHKIVKQLSLFAEILAILIIEVFQVHVFDAKVPLHFCDTLFEQSKVFGVDVSITVEDLG